MERNDFMFKFFKKNNHTQQQEVVVEPNEQALKILDKIAEDFNGAYADICRLSTNYDKTVSFEQARQQIEDMTSLTDKETEEILAKIIELEEIINSKEKKKTKWEKAKGVLVWLADKSFDVGMALLPLLLKIQG